MDKRVEKTKDRIEAALILLLGKLRIDEITVTRLCEQANVNRSTFYVHYSNVMECFEEITDKIIDEMKKITKSNRDMDTYLEAYFTMARKNQNVFKAIHSTSIHHPAIIKMVELNNEILHLGFYIPKLSENLKYSFLFCGYYGMVEAWLKNGCIETNEELISIAKEMGETL